MLSNMQRSHLRFTIAATTIALDTAMTLTAPAAIADPTTTTVNHPTPVVGGVLKGKAIKPEPVYPPIK